MSHFASAEIAIVRDLHEHPTDMSSVFKELSQLQRQDPKTFRAELAQLNKDLHAKGELPGLEIVDDTKTPAGFKVEPFSTMPIPSDASPPPSPTSSGSSGASGGDAGGGDAGGGDAGGGSGGSGGGGGDAGGGSGGGGSGGDVGGGSGGDAGGASGGGSGGGSTYDGASGAVSEQTLLSNVKTVAAVAKSLGVDPATAVADMLVESQGNNKAIGDGGNSVGLFQLNINGEGAGMSVAQRENPTTNAEIALKVFAQNRGISDPGALAAASERPKNPGAYAVQVDNNLKEARTLLAKAGVKP